MYILRIVLLSLVMGHCHQLTPFGVENLKDHLVYIVGGATVVVSGIVGYVIGKKNTAQQLEHERLLQQEKQKQDQAKKIEDARYAVHEIKKSNAREFAYIQDRGQVTKEVLNKASLQFAHHTPFIHAALSVALERELEKVRSAGFSLEGAEKKEAEEVEKKLTLLLETNNHYYKDDIAKELEEAKKAEAQQKILDTQVALKAEKYKAKQRKTEFFQSAKDTIVDVGNHAHHKMHELSQNAQNKLNDFGSKASAINEGMLIQLGMVFSEMRKEISQHGLNSLSSEVKSLKHEIAELKKTDNHAAEVLQKVSERVSQTIDAVQHLKDEVKKLPNNESKKILETLERIDAEVARMGADLGDLKNGTPNGAPSAPPQDF